MQPIDKDRLRAAAARLEWTLNQYSESGEVVKLLSGLSRLIDEAKAGAISVPTERIPCNQWIAEGLYRDFDEPNIESAYYAFATEMRGGQTERERERQARMQAAWQIDKEKFKAAADRLEWVPKQYPDQPVAQEMPNGPSALIEDAKAGNITPPYRSTLHIFTIVRIGRRPLPRP